MVYLGKKKKKKTFWFHLVWGFHLFWNSAASHQGPQNVILCSCVTATLCRENLLQALVDVHMDATLRGGTSGGHDRRL